MRKLKELQDLEKEFSDKVWYNRHLCLKDKIDSGKDKCDPEIRKGALKSAQRVLKTYGKKNLEFDTFDWGMLNGKLSAIRWMLGEDWDMLDT